MKIYTVAMIPEHKANFLKARFFGYSLRKNKEIQGYTSCAKMNFILKNSLPVSPCLDPC